MCFGQAYNWYVSSHPLELSYIFFDRGEHFINGLRARWLANKTPDGKLTPGGQNLYWDNIADIQEVDMDCSPPIQAADMIAWARSRSLSDRARPWKHLADVMLKVIPSTHAFIGEKEMRAKSPLTRRDC